MSHLSPGYLGFNGRGKRKLIEWAPLPAGVSTLLCSSNICSPNSSAEKCRVQKDLPLVRTISYSNCSPSPYGEWGGLRGALGR